MTAFSQLLDQRYNSQLDAAAKRYINHIVDGGIRMKAMIDGILELSRINNKKLANSNPTDLQQALDIALENLNLICLETQAVIHHSALPTLYVDKNHIVQLLQNLIGNAIKFQGAEPPQINIVAKPQTDRWLFSIQDNGVGIPQDQQQRIFKLFQRLHNQQEQKGYGIGLAICKKNCGALPRGYLVRVVPWKRLSFLFHPGREDLCKSLPKKITTFGSRQ